MLYVNVMMACSITTTSSSSSNCTSSVPFIEAVSLPTISLDAATAADDDDEQDQDTGDERFTAVDSSICDVSDEVAESKRVPRAGHDRKKHASYR